MAIKVNNNFDPVKAGAKIKAAIGLYGTVAGNAMEGDAKIKAPWTDRTGNARNSIQGKFGWKGNQAVITLSGNMNYSVYLELANEKKYAILKPTVDKWTPNIISGYQRLVR